MLSLRTSLHPGLRTSSYKLLALLLLTLAGAFTPAAAQRVGMIQSLSYPSSVGNLRTATDPAGNTYYVGCFQDRIDIAGTVMTALPAGDQSVNIYFAKFDAAGQLQWLRQGGSPGTGGSNSTGHEIVYDVALDGAGAVYVAGISREGAQFGTTTLDSVGTFLVKLDAATGNFLWARLVGHSTSVGGIHPRSYLVDIAATPTDVYFSGTFLDNDELDGIPLQNGHLGQSAVVGRCSPGTGFQPGIVTAVWQCVPTDTLARSLAGAICISPTGGLVITGGYTGTVRFGGEAGSPTHTAGRISPYGVEYFIVRLTPSALGGSTQEVIDRLPLASTLVLDAQANCYFTGYVPQGDSIGHVIAADSGMYIARLDRAPGRGVRWVSIAHSASRAATYYLKVVLHPGTGRLYGMGQLTASQLQMGAYSLTNPTGNFGAFVASLDTAAGTVQWARAFNGGLDGLNLPMGLGVDASSRAYLAGITNFGISSPAMTFDGLTIRAGSAYLMRIDPGAQVTGTAYLDQNANGARDAGEPAFPRPVVVQDAAAGTVATSGPDGLYQAVVPIGNYTLAADAPTHYTVSAPATNQRTGNIAVLGQVDTGRDFGLAPVANRPDVRVTFTPVGRVRPGFANRYRARVENLGTTPVSGVLRVTLDAATPYTGAQPAPATQAGAVATWNFTNLAPFGILNYDIAATVLLNVALGTILNSSATVAVAADIDPTNNADSVQQTVTGSWDPNDLAVNYTSLTPAQIAANTPLDYTVRFQNMGTDTAFTVVITDTLPAHLLRIGTLQLLSSSHNCWWQVLDNNRLVIRFENINLRAQSQSSLGSMGFARFRVLPGAGLQAGATIPNTAHIFFDFNAPVTTNEVSTLVQSPNGLVAEAAADAAMWSLYPNPVSRADLVRLTTDAPATVAVVDALGRTVATAAIAPDAPNLDVRGLAPGLYVVRLTQPDGTATSRQLVVR